MATLSQFRRKMERIRDGVDELIEQSFDQVGEDIVRLQKEQLYHGFNPNGDRLEPYRNGHYADYKHNLNPLPGIGNPDFYKTGAFYRGIHLRIEGNRLVLSSSDSKTPVLESREGGPQNVWGLSPEYRSLLFRDHLRPQLIRNLKNALR